MAVNISYTHYSDTIKSAKMEMDTGIYQMIEPVFEEEMINNVLTEVGYLKIDIYDERLSSTISKKYSVKDIEEYIRVLQRLSVEIINPKKKENK